ncbi:C45 family autoproteolytic acyltransferase/hydolase [Stappia stellulata]|uniref:C45 family autoproteolytic acyltransferase/hydolase n=1 Tax=Stappia stellulata TaxID=71235 RepID=UPI00040778E3|nr:C45 family peptidase [Stappia stellulata]
MIVAIEEGQARELRGDAWQRGRAQASAPGSDAARVAAATVARVIEARRAGVFDDRALSYLAAQRRFVEENDPHSLAEVSGIAEGFGMKVDDLFAHLHMRIVGDLGEGATLDGAPLDGDGCSAFALGAGRDGPLVAKNRDFSGAHLGIQTVFRHSGPDIATGSMLCVGSLGSPGAYSSGMNARGLMLADTQIGARTHRVGWLRYFLMTRVLARCSDVAEALAFIRSVPHAGGGSLILADAAGAVAGVELGAASVAVEEGERVLRTNHFLSEELARDTLPPDDDRIAANSEQRLAFLSHRLPALTGEVAEAMELMARHTDDAGEPAPVCQHAQGADAQTLSSVVYSGRDRCLYFHEGTPCLGKWKRFAL